MQTFMNQSDENGVLDFVNACCDSDIQLSDSTAN